MRELYSTLNVALEKISSLETENSMLKEGLDGQIENIGNLVGDVASLQEFEASTSHHIPRAAPTVTIDVNDTINRDLGAVISDIFESGTIELNVQLHLSSNDSFVYDWDEVVVVPEGSILRIYGVGSLHKGISQTGEAGAADDRTRCPITILMDDARFAYRPGTGYDGSVQYQRIIQLPHSRVSIQGVTIRENIDVIDESHSIYEHGIITVRGPFSSLIVRDSRVEFGRLTFVNSHSAGRTFVTFGHVRFVGLDEFTLSTNDVIYPVMSSRGQSWNGNVCEVAVTGGTIEGNVMWHEPVLDGEFQLIYLAL
eukprot:m.133413 g.133413  ORF g.133413 m.133413 type:complete len:311 (-) comp9492_c1_seq26:2700-3632(-)